MADCDPPLHAGRNRPLRDLAKLRRAGLPTVMQMKIDSFSESFGEPKDDIELALGVTVKARGIQTADQVRARPQSRRQQVGSAVFRDDAALRECNKLNVDPVTINFTNF